MVGVSGEVRKARGAVRRHSRIVDRSLRSVTVWYHERVHGELDRTTAVLTGHHGHHGTRRGRRPRTGQRVERTVRRARGPGGRGGDSRQQPGDRGVPPGTPASPSHQLLHRVAGSGRPACRPGGHTVRRAV